MKILHVVENLNLGGLETVLLNLIATQIRHGQTVVVVCLFEEGVLAPKLYDLNVPLSALHKRGGLDFEAVGALRKTIHSYKPDVIHTHNAVCNYYTVLAALFLGCRIVNTRHGMGGDASRNRGNLLYRLSLLFTHKSIFVCDKARIKFGKMLGIPSAKSCVIYNGINTENYDCQNLKHEQQELRNAYPQKQIIGTIGRLNAFKDQATLIKSFAIVKEKIPHVMLVLVGDGELRETLCDQVQQYQLQDNVIFLGARSDVNQLLCQIDIFVMTSLTEGFSIALLEACAARRAIVTTDVGGNPEIIRHEFTGLLVQPGHENEIAQAIIRLLQSPELAQRLAENAYDWVQQHGTLEKMYENYQALYTS